MASSAMSGLPALQICLTYDTDLSPSVFDCWIHIYWKIWGFPPFAFKYEWTA